MLKTHKATAKRIRITKTGKVMQKKKGQDHFNARDKGKVTRSKRRLLSLDKTFHKNLKRLLPYN